MLYDIVPVTEEHIQNLITEMATMEALELKLLGGMDPEEGVRTSLEVSTMAFAGEGEDGETLGIFGFRDLHPIGRVGIPWALTTSHIYDRKYALPFVKYSKAVLDIVLSTRYDLLTNIVWEANLPALQYLKLIGMEFEGPHLSPSTGVGYYRFHKARGSYDV